MSDVGAAVSAILTLIIVAAIIAFLVSKQSGAANAISTLLGGFAGIVGRAMGPLTGGSSSSSGMFGGGSWLPLSSTGSAASSFMPVAF